MQTFSLINYKHRAYLGNIFVPALISRKARETSGFGGLSNQSTLTNCLNSSNLTGSVGKKLI